MFPTIFKEYAMKKTIAGMIIIAIFGSFALSCKYADCRIVKPNQVKKMKRFAMFPLKSENETLGTEIANNFEMYLAGKSDAGTEFEFVERSQLQKLLKEQNLTMAGVVDNPSLMAGKVKGVDAILIGTVRLKTLSEAGQTCGQQALGCISLGMYRPKTYAETSIYPASVSVKLVDVQSGVVLAYLNYEKDSYSEAKFVGEEMAKAFYTRINALTAQR